MTEKMKITADVDGVQTEVEGGKIRFQPRILIVDDSRAMRNLATGVLTTAGMKTETAEHGSAALAILEEMRGETTRPFDLILLDMEMPVLDGRGFLKVIRSDPQWKSLPVLVCTTRGDREFILETAQYDISGYVLKPYTTPKLLVEVRRIIFGNTKDCQASLGGDQDSGSALVAHVLSTIESSIEDALALHGDEDCPVASAVKTVVANLRKEHC